MNTRNAVAAIIAVAASAWSCGDPCETSPNARPRWADGTYPATLSIYSVDSGGTPEFDVDVTMTSDPRSVTVSWTDAQGRALEVRYAVVSRDYLE